MNDYQDYRSYGSYLSRVFAIIIAFLLIIFAIWAVVRVASEDDDTLGGTTAPSFSEGEDEDENSDDDSDLFVRGDADANDDVPEPTSEDAVASDDEGHTLSTNTDIAQAEADDSLGNVAGTTSDDLPDTGAEFSIVLVIGALAYITSRAVLRSQE